VVAAVRATVGALSAAGLRRDGLTVTGGGTGTFPFECEVCECGGALRARRSYFRRMVLRVGGGAVEVE